jgi:hypothetical protein
MKMITIKIRMILMTMMMMTVVMTMVVMMSRDGVVSRSIDYGLYDRGVGVRVCQEFSLLHVVQTGSGSTQPPIQWVPGALSQGVKWQRREVDHSPQTSAEVKTMWIYTFIPPYAFMV